MSKKQKKRAVRSGAEARHRLAIPALEQQGRAALEGERWRDAVADYKELLKREVQPHWQQGLADAYAGRAQELTTKGMLKEALAIWENRAAIDASIPMHSQHAALLVRLGQPQAVIKCLSDDKGEAMPREQRDALRAQLAAQVVGGNQELLKQLPADDPVRVHAEPALAALSAYCEGRDEDLRAALAAIPFRSPYRDWVQLLKVLQRKAEAPEAAPDQIEAQLVRIDDDSPFAPIKQAAQLSLLSERAFADAAHTATASKFQVACALRGWLPARLTLWQELSKLGVDPNPRALMRLLHRHVEVLGHDWVRRKTLTLVSIAEYEGVQWLRECGAAELNDWEHALIAAWDNETDPYSDPEDIVEGWDHCANVLKESLKASRAQAKFSHPQLRIALMLRRSEAQLKILKESTDNKHSEYYERLLITSLEESLRWDPDYCDTYLTLIDFYRRSKKLKDARRVLEQAQKRWPQNIQLLTAAMKIALDGGAFKKAAALAKKILDIDPINSDVRRRLINAHFSHASKQIDKQRLDLARKELLDASDWARSDEAREQLALALSLVDLIANNKDVIEALKARWSERANSFDARLELIVASSMLGVKPSDIERVLKLKQPKGQGREDLLGAIERLRGHTDNYRNLGKDLIATIEKTLSQAKWQQLERTELETACDTLYRFRQFKACENATKSALKRWPGEPIFVLYWFQAKYPNGFTYRHMPDLRQLEEAWDSARDQGDTRTAMRIEKVLPQGPPIFGGGFPMPPMFFDDDEDDEDDEDDLDSDELLDMIESLGPIAALEAMGAPKSLIQQLKSLEKSMGPDHLAEMLESLLDGEMDSVNPFNDLPFPSGSPKRGRKAKSGAKKRR